MCAGEFVLISVLWEVYSAIRIPGQLPGCNALMLASCSLAPSPCITVLGVIREKYIQF